MVDQEDVDRCLQLKWSVKRGNVFTTLREGPNKWRLQSLARFIMGFTPEYPFTFINGDKMDHRKQNISVFKRKRQKQIAGMDSKWSAFKEKLLCKSSNAATS